jgi:HEAT repeat protein
MAGDKRITFAVAVMGVALAVGLCLALTRQPKRPTFAGKPLRDWLPRFDNGFALQQHLEHTLGGETTNSPFFALREMGEDAVPYLVHELRARDSRAKVMLVRLLQKQSLMRMNFTPAPQRHERALQGCIAVGEPAKSAVPQITQLIGEEPSLSTYALAAAGPEGLEPLTSALTNSACIVRLRAAMAFNRVSCDAQAAVPALVQRLGDLGEDPRVRSFAAAALAHIAKRPDLAVPVLTRSLNDQNEGVRASARWALTRVRLDRQ